MGNPQSSSGRGAPPPPISVALESRGAEAEPGAGQPFAPRSARCGLRAPFLPGPGGCTAPSAGGEVCPRTCHSEVPRLPFQPFLSPLTDQWRRRRQRRLWFEEQVRPSGVQEAGEGVQGAEKSRGEGGRHHPPF